jgi:predicted secreted protein
VSKISGLGAKITLADNVPTVRTISNDITDFTLNTPINLFDWTGVDKSAHERGAGLSDLTVQLKGVCNFAANQSHAVLSTATTSATARALAVFPTNNGSTPTLPANVLIGAYNVARAADGNLTFQADLSLADGGIPTWA